MTLLKRRIIFVSFILLFVIIAPLLVLYTIGYRYNFKSSKVEKVGLLYIRTIPEDMPVYINGEMVSKSTPTRIDDLLPNSYLITIKRNGYYTWEKELRVHSAETTFATNILILKEENPIEIDSGEISNLLLSSPSFLGKALLYSTNTETGQELWISNPYQKDTKNLVYRTVSETPEDRVKILDWFPDNQTVLLKEKSRNKATYTIIDTEDPQKSFSLNKLVKEPIHLTKYSARDDFVYISTSSNRLWQLNYKTQNTRLIDTDIESDFYILNGEIYFIKTYNGKKYLVKKPFQFVEDQFALMAPFNKEKEETLLLSLDAKSNYSFYPLKQDFIVLINAEAQDMLIYDTKNDTLLINASAKNVIENNKSELLYYNDFEIWTFSPETGESELINRYGAKIQKALWHPKNSLILYLLENQIYAIELDGRDKRNIWKLTKDWENVLDFTIDQNGEYIYYTTDLGLYKLKIM